MLRVGLTGGTATGKSTVMEMLRGKKDVRTFDADTIVHRLYQPDTEVFRKVVERFGSSILTAGNLDRKKLAEIVFKVPGELAALERIVHPAVVAAQKMELDALAHSSPKAIAVVEATKMLEAGTYKDYDRVLLVVCRPEVQLERFRLRQTELSAEAAQFELARRTEAQFSDTKRRSLVPAEWVIDNSGSKEETAAQVGRIYEKLRHEAQ